MDSPLLLYIDVRHPYFFPPNLIVGEAWDFGPPLVRIESLVPVRDDSAYFVSQNHIIHRPVKEPQAQVQTAEQAVAQLVNSSKVDTNQGEDEMVVKRSRTLNRFLPSTCPAAQQ